MSSPFPIPQRSKQTVQTHLICPILFSRVILSPVPNSIARCNESFFARALFSFAAHMSQRSFFVNAANIQWSCFVTVINISPAIFLYSAKKSPGHVSRKRTPRYLRPHFCNRRKLFPWTAFLRAVHQLLLLFKFSATRFCRFSFGAPLA